MDLVEFVGPDASTPPANGYVAANLRDGDPDTFFNADGPTGGYIGLDAEVAVVITRIRLMARNGGTGLDAWDLFANGTTIKSSSTGWPTFTNDATIGTLPAYPDAYYQSRWYSDVEIPASTARRYYRAIGAAGTYGPSVAEWRWIGPAVDGAKMRPLPPVMSPQGGRYPSAIVTFELSSETESGQIFYTVNGGDPDNSSTLYTGPVTLPISADGLEIRAVTYRAGFEEEYSDVVFGRFVSHAWKNGEHMNDTRGARIEAHDGRIFDNRARDGYLWWNGTPANLTNLTAGVDIGASRGLMLYRSTDWMNWEPRGDGYGYFLPNFGDTPYVQRTHIVYNPNTDKYVLLGHGVRNPSGSTCVIAQADTMDGEWEWIDEIALPGRGAGVGNRDFNVYQYNNELWLIYTDVTNGSVNTCRMADNFLELHATPQHTTIILGDREAPVLFRRNSIWYLITSSSNYYDSTSTFNVSYLMANGGDNPAEAPWPSVGDLGEYAVFKRDLYPYDPVDTYFNAQPTAVVRNGNAFFYMSDWWNPAELYDSRYVFYPLFFYPDGTMQAIPLINFHPNDQTKRFDGVNPKRWRPTYTRSGPRIFR